MLWNFIKGTYRSLAAYRSFTIINILGLAIGITCTLIISLYVIHESNYDKFHSNPDLIYRVTLDGSLNGIEFKGALTSGPLSGALNNDIEEVESSTRIVKFGAWLIARDNIRNNEDQILFVDTNFFSFFDGFKLIHGDPKTAFNKKYGIVLTEDAAMRYFSRLDVVGEKLKVEGDRYFIITGVMENPPTNTHILFDMLGTLKTFEQHVQFWTNNRCYTYFRLKEGMDITVVESRIKQFFPKYVLPELNEVFESSFDSDDTYDYKVQRVENIHLLSNVEGDIKPGSKVEYVYAFGIAAILILIIACLNFMNLSSANSINRSKEVILRKVTGAHKHILVLQFLVESVVYSVIAMFLALILTELILPAFNHYLDLNLEYHFLADLPVVIVILVLSVILGMLSGIYPALFISSFDPVTVLQGKLGEGLRNSKVRAVFVVFQFFISILIITLTMTIYSQVNYMLNKDLGFDSENVMVIRRSDALSKNADKFKQDLLSNDNILSVTNSNSIPGREFTNIAFKIQELENQAPILLNQVFVNYDFGKTYKLQLAEGRFFNPDIKSDSFACLINETAARIIGLSYPLGYHLEQPSFYKKKEYTFQIIGVVKDFHFQSVEEEVEPLVICMRNDNFEGYINVKLSASNMDNSINYISKAWKKYSPEYPFVYFFMKDDFKVNYNPLMKLGRIFLIFSILAILIATLGLFGLFSYALNQRTREIGIRRALGASGFTMILMLSKETFKLVTFAAILGWITSYFLGNYWLGTFHYHISFKPIYFLTSYLFVLMSALFVVVYQALRKITEEPGVILKYD